MNSDILEVERLIHDRVSGLVTMLKKGIDAGPEEKRIAEIRAVLERLKWQRRNLVRAAYAGTVPAY